MYDAIYDTDTEYVQEQVEGHEKIEERKDGCFYCAYFNDCHTAVWRKGQTCELFIVDKNKAR